MITQIPSLPCGKTGLDSEGYQFSTEQQKICSYFVAMEGLGKVNENGCELSLDMFYDSSFFLPFKLSHELSNYSPDISDRVLMAPTIKNSRTRLFLEFNSATTYVIR